MFQVTKTNQEMIQPFSYLLMSNPLSTRCCKCLLSINIYWCTSSLLYFH